MPSLNKNNLSDLESEIKALESAASEAAKDGDEVHQTQLLNRSLTLRRLAREKKAGVQS